MPSPLTPEGPSKEPNDTGIQGRPPEAAANPPTGPHDASRGRQQPPVEGEQGRSPQREIQYSDLPREEQSQLEASGLTPETLSKVTELGRIHAETGTLSDAQSAQLDAIFAKIQKLDPALRQKVIQMAARTGQEIDEHVPSIPEDPSRLVDTTGNQVNQSAAEQEAARVQQEGEARVHAAQQAVHAAMNNTDPKLDVELAQDAAAKLHHARQKADEHNADHYGGAITPWWGKALKALGVAFYLYIGLQYATASFVENASKGSK